MSQLHKRFKDDQVKELFTRYLNKEIERKYIQEILEIKKRRFFALLQQYRQDPSNFSIQYKRREPIRISQDIEENILKELCVEEKIIKDKDVPLNTYNYSYIKDVLESKYNQKVSLPTIIERAKKNGFYLKRRKRKAHDREVLTNYAGELIQHDASYHLYSPPAKEKWHLITSLDDFLKPIAYDRFLKAINRITERLKAKRPESPISKKKDRDDVVFLKCDNTEHKIRLSDIKYIEGYGNFVNVHTLKKVILISEKMKTIEENLSGTDFIRIHKSYIVSLDKIERIEKNTIHLQGEVIPIGRFYKRAFDEILKLHQL